MRKILFVLVAGLIVFAACNSASEETKSIEKAGVAKGSGETYVLDTTGSSLEWYAAKQTGKHHGTFVIEDGAMKVDDGQLTGGTVEIDVTDLAVSDLEGDDKAKLEGHLKSPDFFEVEKYPKARFVITSIAPATTAGNGSTHLVSGNLTLKDSTRNISFPATIDVSGEKLIAKADFTIDRTEWGLNYKGPNNPQDWFIKKDVDLKLNIEANRK